MASYRSFRGSKGTLGPCRAVCLWRVGLESCWGSAVSHPYGSFSCRFCGFQEGAFSMASYRSFRGSKGTSCVFFASNVGCSMTFVGPCGPKFFVFGLLVNRKLVSMTDVLPRRSEVFNDRRAALAFGGFDVGPSACGGFVFDLFPAVRTGAFRADFVASKKVRFRWLPTGVLGVQRVRQAPVGPSVFGGLGWNPAGALPFRIRTGAVRADFVASKKVRFRWLPTGVLGVQKVR